MENLINWIKPPTHLKRCFIAIWPLIFSQFCLRVFHILDNRFVAKLGAEAIYIHNIQYTFIVFGQFIGIAGATAGLVFWNRKEIQERKAGLVLQLLLSTAVVTVTCGILFHVFNDQIVTFFKIPIDFRVLAKIYLQIGVVNMILYALYLMLDGILIANNLQIWSFIFAFALGLSNFAADYFSVRVLFRELTISSTSISNAFICIGLSTAVILSIVIVLIVKKLHKKMQGWKFVNVKDFSSVWGGEIGVAMIRSVSPLIYPIQFAMIHGSAGFINTYYISLHVAFLCCLPLTAGVQLAVKKASSDASYGHHSRNNPPTWWSAFFYTGFIPTYIMLAIAALWPTQILKFLYGYLPAEDHLGFLSIFFVACIIGQFGHIFAIAIRAAKKNYLITRNFVVSQFGFHLGVMQLLIFLSRANPITAGLTITLSSTAYSGLNYMSNRKICEGD